MPPKGPYLNGRRYWANIPGEGRKPLVAPGEKMATTNPAIAAQLYADWIKRIEAKRLGLVLGIEEKEHIAPGDFAIKYLDERKQKRREKRGLRSDEPLPRRDIEALEKSKSSIDICLESPALVGITSLHQVTDDHIKELITWLRDGGRRTRQGKKLKPGGVRRILMELSGMLTEAVPRYLARNPIPRHRNLPVVRKRTALDRSKYLDRFQVRALLANVRYSSKNPWAVEQACTLFYTGARLSEVSEMLLSDFDFHGQEVHFVEYEAGAGGEARDVKNWESSRSCTFWPRLQAVIKASIEQVPRNKDGLAFPVQGTEHLPLSEQRAMRRLRYTLKSAAERAGITDKQIGHHLARHSFISARQEMVEVDSIGRERPVPTAYIAEEVGHTDEKEIRRTYGHLPKTGVRQAVLDYGEPDLLQYMARYRRKRARLAKRRTKREGQRARPRPRTS